jgi:hypothetical protein
MEIHSDPAPSEGHALHAQPQALFLAVFTRQGDPTARSHHAMPRKPSPPVQCSYGQTRGAREASGFGHLAVRDHPPTRHIGNHSS